MKNNNQTKADTDDQPETTSWESLTWNDLEAWAGNRSVSRGRAYQREGRVRKLVHSEDGRLLATVQGTDRYVVTVWLEEGGGIDSTCTCPVGEGGCKHAVAVVAEYLDQIGRGAEVPLTDANDPRWQMAEEEDATDDFDEDDESDESVEEEPRSPAPAKTSRSRKDLDEKIRQHICAKSREDLADLVCSLTQRFPELRDEFRERIELGEGNVDRLVAQARKELHRITSEPAWQNHWSGEGNIPDYSKLIHRLERLVELGHADAVTRLAPEIMERGMEQVGQAQDEGDTAIELAKCLAITFKAVANSTLSPARKLLIAIDACNDDDYGVIDDEAEVVFAAKYEPADWSEVADILFSRLKATGGVKNSEDDESADQFSTKYHRDRISRWIVEALENAGREGEVFGLLEAECRRSGSYERLVGFLVEQKRHEDARCWAREGIEKTAESLPGIAMNLAGQLRDIAVSNKQWDIVGAHAALAFFQRPGTDTFKELVSAADKAGCGEAVRRCAFAFLESGVPPMRMISSRKGERKMQTAPDWPLPTPEYLLPLMRSDERNPRRAEPHYDVLISMAIADHRPDDVLRWYDQQSAGSKQQKGYASSWSGASGCADSVAEAVAKSHPQRALDIYWRRVNQHLPQTGISAYESVAGYLKKMKPIMKTLHRENEWTRMVSEIRVRHHNRPRFMEILDRLEHRPIIATAKARK